MATKTKRTRWVCPQCDHGHLGPTRPRKDNIVRYCLPCSEKEGKLIERVPPSLEKRRSAQAEKAKAKRQAKLAREKAAEKKRTHLTLWDEGGRIVEVDVEKTVRGFAKKAGMRTGFDFTWNRRTDGGNSGRANEYHVHMSVGSRSLEKFCKLAAHELAHAKAGAAAGHSDKWKDAYEEICAKLWDTKPVYRGEVDHHRYAIDPKILEQLEATSRGEYKRCKAKLPLAGKQIGSWQTVHVKCTCSRGFSVKHGPLDPCVDGMILERPCGSGWNEIECIGPDCKLCGGSGTIPARECPGCNGTGLTPKRVEVTDAV